MQGPDLPPNSLNLAGNTGEILPLPLPSLPPTLPPSRESHPTGCGGDSSSHDSDVALMPRGVGCSRTGRGGAVGDAGAGGARRGKHADASSLVDDNDLPMFANSAILAGSATRESGGSFASLPIMSAEPAPPLLVLLYHNFSRTLSCHTPFLFSPFLSE